MPPQVSSPRHVRAPRCAPRRAPAGVALVLLAAFAWPGSAAAAARPGEAAAWPTSPTPATLAPTGTSAQASGQLDVALGDRLTVLINQIRRRAGRSPLEVDLRDLTAVAESRVGDMMSLHKVTAAGAGAPTVLNMLVDRGVSWRAAGEAVAWSPGGAAVDPLNGLLVSLLASPQGRTLILSKDATEVGVAVGILDDQLPVTLADRHTSVPPAPLIAIASVVAIDKSGPNPPGIELATPKFKSGASLGLTAWPDSAGRLSVVVTNIDGDLLAVIAWNRQVSGRTSLRWNGRIGSAPAVPGTYEIRAFTVDDAGIASDPLCTEITVTR